MKKVVIERPYQVAVVDVPEVASSGQEVLLRIGYAGICGSDFMKYRGKYPALRYPVVPGHEFTGEVDRVQAADGWLKPGDRVVVNPNLPCGHCLHCARGRNYLCRNLKVIGAHDVEGAMQQYIWVPEANVIKIDEGVDEKNISLTEPLSIAIHAVRGRALGSRVLLLGLGTIGLLVLNYLPERDMEIDIIDVSIDDLNLPQKPSLHRVMSVEDAQAARSSLAETYDTVLVICPYDSDLVRFCAELAVRGGQIILVGLPTGAITTDFNYLLNKEITLYQSYKDSEEDFAAAYRYLKNHDLTTLLDVEVFPLDRAAEAFHAKESHPRSKIILDCRR